MSEQKFRFLGRAVDRPPRPPIVALAPDPKTEDDSAVMRLYDPIDSWGGEWGVSAKEFVDALDQLPDGVKTINLHINSPGGEVWEAVTILNALRTHPARVVAHVDGVAASAASFIATGADEVVMGRNTELMIHDARGVALGNAEVMRDLANRLDQHSNNIASIYAEKAGGTVEDWRAAMRAETWYNADEAVAAGLADKVEEAPDQGEAAAKNRYDLSIFNYEGRAKAPAPPLPQPRTAKGLTPAQAIAQVHAAATKDSAGASASAAAQEGAGMFDPAKIREALGLAADSSDDEVTAALTANGLVVNQQPEGEPAGETPDPKPLVASSGAVMVDPSALAALREQAAKGEAAHKRLVRQERDTVIAQAIKDGKFSPARKEHFEQLWDKDPEGTKATIDGFAKGLIPTSERGSAGGPDLDADAEIYASLYGGEKAGV